MSKYLTTSEAAQSLGVSEDSLRSWDASGELVPSRTPGGHRRYTQEQLDKFIKKEKVMSYVAKADKLRTERIEKEELDKKIREEKAEIERKMELEQQATRVKKHDELLELFKQFDGYEVKRGKLKAGIKLIGLNVNSVCLYLGEMKLLTMNSWEGAIYLSAQYIGGKFILYNHNNLYNGVTYHTTHELPEPTSFNSMHELMESVVFEVSKL